MNKEDHTLQNSPNKRNLKNLIFNSKIIHTLINTLYCVLVIKIGLLKNLRNVCPDNVVLSVPNKGCPNIVSIYPDALNLPVCMPPI